MSTATFATPVTILVGLGFPCRIRSANSALVYLNDRPASERDDVWDAAVAACRDALADKTSGEEARNVFAAYARRRDILVEDTMPPIRTKSRYRTRA